MRVSASCSHFSVPNFCLTFSSAPVDVGEDVADDGDVAETSSSPQSNGKLLHITNLVTVSREWLTMAYSGCCIMA